MALVGNSKPHISTVKSSLGDRGTPLESRRRGATIGGDSIVAPCVESVGWERFVVVCVRMGCRGGLSAWGREIVAPAPLFQEVSFWNSINGFQKYSFQFRGSSATMSLHPSLSPPCAILFKPLNILFSLSVYGIKKMKGERVCNPKE